MTQVVFQVEEYTAMREEATLLLREHADEVAAHKELPLDPDFALYAKCALDGTLHIVTARADGVLVGYHVSFLTGHLHYRNHLTAYSDLYYLKPEHRKGWTGVRFLRFVDESLEARGVQRVFTTTTIDADKSAVLRRLGHRECERVYVKMLGGNHE
jgi:hypothetical protein